MSLEELQNKFADKQQEIVSKRRSGGYASLSEDIQEQKDVWEWFKKEKYKLTGDYSDIVNEAKKIVEDKFDIIRKGLFWDNNGDEKEMFNKVAGIFEVFEDTVSFVGINKTDVSFKEKFINEAILIIKEFSFDKSISELKNTDMELCNSLYSTVQSYYKELGL